MHLSIDPSVLLNLIQFLSVVIAVVSLSRHGAILTMCHVQSLASNAGLTLFLSPCHRAHEHSAAVTIVRRLLHHGHVDLRAGARDSIGTGQILALYMVNAVRHDDGRLSASHLIHFCVSNELSRVIFKFEHGGSRCYVRSLVSSSVHRKVSTSCIKLLLRARLELAQIDRLKSFDPAVATRTLLSSCNARICLKIATALSVRRHPTASYITASIQHHVLKLLLLHVCQVYNVTIDFLQLISALTHTSDEASSTRQLSIHITFLNSESIMLAVLHRHC